ncbi:hypothetical protein QQP08_015368 [Theobroma cacao]|nr:hypothetical protein QQP08_015368 [Theobroma cacao]
MMLPPSYHPSFGPCRLIPKARERTAQTKSMIMIVSLTASRTKLKKLFAGCFWYLFAPKTLVRSTRSISSPVERGNLLNSSILISQTLQALLFHHLGKTLRIDVEDRHKFVATSFNVDGNERKGSQKLGIFFHNFLSQANEKPSHGYGRNRYPPPSSVVLRSWRRRVFLEEHGGEFARFSRPERHAVRGKGKNRKEERVLLWA